MPAGQEESAPLRVTTLGAFALERDGVAVPTLAWRRDKALQLFQFLLTERGRPLHREAIVDRLWPDLAPAAGERDFKVALHAMLAVLEPGRGAREAFRHVVRHEQAYALDLGTLHLDADELERQVRRGNAAPAEAATEAYQVVADLYAGEYLPERRFEDWASAERERLQTLALSAITRLARLLLDRAPLESLRLAQRVLAQDRAYEDAWRAEMLAHAALGNRALALRAYTSCAEYLHREYGAQPLPETQRLYRELQEGRLAATRP